MQTAGGCDSHVSRGSKTMEKSMLNLAHGRVIPVKAYRNLLWEAFTDS